MTTEQSNEIEEIVKDTINVQLRIAKFLFLNSKQYQKMSDEEKEKNLMEFTIENALKDRGTANEMNELRTGLYQQLLILQ